MKNSLIILIILCCFIACQNHKQQEATQNNAPVSTETKAAVKTDTALVFSCPMHPEVTGKEGDKCPKCGMALERKN